MDTSMAEQTEYLMFHACEDSPTSAMCQKYLSTNWPDMANCLYNQWMFADLACLYFGGCQQTSHYWGCPDVSGLIARVLADPLSVIPGAEQHLHGPCYCQADAHSGDKNCEDMVTDIMPAVMPAMASWVVNQTERMCTGGGGRVAQDSWVTVCVTVVLFSVMLN